jgi:Domain of unknown function (DUF1707)/Cell wall-active antibiotics response 4TMS YvqF
VTRASDDERERTAGRLREAAGEGRLGLEELAERLDAAYAATTRAELEPLVADLPAAERAPARPGRATTFILGLLGGGDRRGRWRVAERVLVVNGIGGADLDLREAVLDGPKVELTIVSLIGGSDITVPEGVRVEVSGFALVGGNDVQLEGPEPPPGAPVVRVRAFTLVGGTDVGTARSARRPRPGALPPPPRLP